MNKKYYTIIGIAVAIALVLLIGAGVSLHSLMKQNTELTQQVEQQMAKDSLTAEYYNLSHEYDGYLVMNLQNDSLQQLLSREQQRVQDLLEELRMTKASDAQRIAELTRELNTVRGLIQGYVAQIDSLYATNARLEAENQRVIIENQQITTENQQLQEEKRQLTDKVNRAAMLEITSCVVTPLNKRDRKTRYLSQIEKLQIDYTIDKNITCESGVKQVYLLIINPKGDILTTDANHVFHYENADVPYSVQSEIEYTGEAISGQLYWRFDGEPLPGLYNADFIVDGNLIGSYPFELKK